MCLVQVIVVQLVYSHTGECVRFPAHSQRNIPVSFLPLADRVVAHHCFSKGTLKERLEF